MSSDNRPVGPATVIRHDELAADACEDCLARVSSSYQPSASGERMLVIEVSHQHPCPRLSRALVARGIEPNLRADLWVTESGSKPALTRHHFTSDVSGEG